MIGKILRKFNRKYDFPTILDKLLLKIEPWKITSEFFDNVFHFGGREERFRVPQPSRRLCLYKIWFNLVQSNAL